MTMRQKAQILSTLVTRDHAGRHFTEYQNWAQISTLEAQGFIEVCRPVHQTTGIDYSPDYWSVRLTQDGQNLVDSFDYDDQGTLI